MTRQCLPLIAAAEGSKRLVLRHADLTPRTAHWQRSQAIACCIGVDNAVLTPPVEKRSQLTLSTQWPLERPLDGCPMRLKLPKAQWLWRELTEVEMGGWR